MRRTTTAVALKYDTSLPAPLVLAKGRDELARRILDAAEAHGVPVVEEPVLSEFLIECDLGSMIPQRMYAAVASVLAAVYRAETRNNAHTQREMES